MNNITLNAGDIFLTENPMQLGRLITKQEELSSLDGQAKYSHAGIVLDSLGTGFEANWTVRRFDIFKEYSGKGILFARYKKMTPEKYVNGQKRISKHEGQWYPFWRLFQYVLRIERFIHQDRVVCSELAAKFLDGVCRKDGIFEFNHWFGYSPDSLHDVFRRQADFEIIWEGVLP